MTFRSAQCEVCHKDIFKPENLVAYTIRPVNQLMPVKIGQNQPWSGIRVVCKPCIKALSSLLNSEVEPEL